MSRDRAGGEHDPQRLARRLLAARNASKFHDDVPGAKVVGEVVWVGETDNQFGRYPEITILDGKRYVTVFCGRTVLNQKVTACEIGVGDTLGVEYLGRRKATVSGFDYHDYNVVHILSSEALEATPAESSDGADQ